MKVDANGNLEAVNLPWTKKSCISEFVTHLCLSSLIKFSLNLMEFKKRKKKAKVGRH